MARAVAVLLARLAGLAPLAAAAAVDGRLGAVLRAVSALRDAGELEAIPTLAVGGGVTHRSKRACLTRAGAVDVGLLPILHVVGAGRSLARTAGAHAAPAVA